MLFEDRDHRRKAAQAFPQAMLGLAAAALAARYGEPLFARFAPPAATAADRLAFAAQWLVVPGFTLLVGVVAAARRGFHADAIDGTRTPASRGLEINLRYNQNTLEQTMLAAIAWLALSLRLPLERLALIPLMATLFGVGRLTFWIGYLLRPTARAFGMTLTVAPTLAAYGWLAVDAFRG